MKRSAGASNGARTPSEQGAATSAGAASGAGLFGDRLLGGSFMILMATRREEQGLRQVATAWTSFVVVQTALPDWCASTR